LSCLSRTYSRVQKFSPSFLVEENDMGFEEKTNHVIFERPGETFAPCISACLVRVQSFSSFLVRNDMKRTTKWVPLSPCSPSSSLLHCTLNCAALLQMPCTVSMGFDCRCWSYMPHLVTTRNVLLAQVQLVGEFVNDVLGSWPCGRPFRGCRGPGAWWVCLCIAQTGSFQHFGALG